MGARAARWGLLVCSWVVVAEAQLRIMSPKSLASEFPDTHGMVYGTTATFGAPYYGDRVIGQILYGETKGKHHCHADDYVLNRPSSAAKPMDAEAGQEVVDVVLVRRGGCTFVTKVQAAQDKGAHAVVVVDNKGLTSEEVQHIVMADDGYGHRVKIPSMLISKFEGDKLIKAAKEGPVIIELAWNIPRGEVVVADFWMSSGSKESGEFLQRFKECAEALKYNLQFVPRYHVFSLPNGTGYGHLCSRRGSAYCAPDPDGPGPVTGADVVSEDVRQLCIWSTTAKTEPGHDKGAKYSQEFWEYAVRFTSECPVGTTSRGKEWRFSEECSMRVMAAVGISVASVLNCVKEQETKLLNEQIQNVAWSPQALRLNGWRYSGALDPETVLKAVCAGYATPLPACEELLSSYARSYGAAGITVSTFMSALVVFGLCTFVAIYVYRRHLQTSVRKVLREEVMLEVQTQMADYVTLEDSDGRSRGTLSF